MWRYINDCMSRSYVDNDEHISHQTLQGTSSPTVAPHRNRPWKQRTVLEFDMAVEPSVSLVQSNMSWACLPN